MRKPVDMGPVYSNVIKSTSDVIAMFPKEYAKGNAMVLWWYREIYPQELEVSVVEALWKGETSAQQLKYGSD